MDRRHLLALVVGVSLLVNPLWIAPHAGDPRHVYRATPVDRGDVHADSAVLVCGAESSPRCATERRAVTEGVAVGHDPAAFADRPTFVYVESRDRYYRTGVRWIDGARTATGTPVAFETVRNRVARDGPSAFEAPAASVVADAVADGVSRTRTRVVLDDARPDGPVVVADGDSFVAVRRVGTEPSASPFGRYWWLVRGALGAVGVVLVTGVVRAWAGGRG
jgi:hypothetical protein